MTIPAALLTEKNKLNNTGPWIWLFEVRVDDDNAIRVASYTEDVTFDGETFEAANVYFDQISHSTEDEIRTTQMAVANQNQDLTTWMDDNTGMVDCAVLYYLVHSGNLGEDPYISGRFEVTDATIDTAAIAWTLGEAGAYSRDVPFNRFQRAYCRHEENDPSTDLLKDGVCPYDRARPGALQHPCDRTWAECVKRGAEQEASNVKVTLPGMNGSFRSIPLPQN